MKLAVFFFVFFFQLIFKTVYVFSLLGDVEVAEVIIIYIR